MALDRLRRLRRPWARVIAISVGSLVVVATVSVVLFDFYFRQEVIARAEEEYFTKTNEYVVDEVVEQLREYGCDEREGIAAAREFMNREHHRLVLTVVRQPKWGWEVHRYRFVIRWDSTTIVKLALDKNNEPVVQEWGDLETFKDEIKKEVCSAACPWWKCAWMCLSDFVD